MSPLQQVVGTGLLLAGLYVLTRFYRLRVVSCVALLGIWGLVAVAAPIYFAYQALNEGRLFGTVFTLAVSLPIAGLWYVGFDAARKCIADEMRYGRWTDLPWNAR